MTTHTVIGRSKPMARSIPERTRWIGNFAVVCIFSIAGLIITALGLGFIRFEALTQMLAMAG